MRNSFVVAAVAAAVLMPTLAEHAVAQEGHASWYALRSRTASGEPMNPNALTAAHRSLPFGTHVRVTNKSNGRSVVVRINDRGPFVRGRIIDVSRAAAAQLGMLGAGTARVSISHAGSGGAGSWSYSGNAIDADNAAPRRTRVSARSRRGGSRGGPVAWIDGQPGFGG